MGSGTKRAAERGVGEENPVACLFDLSVPFPFFFLYFL